MIEIRYPLKKIFWAAQLFIIFLITSGLLLQAARWFNGNDFVFGLVPYFDADYEASLPTWFSSAFLLICSLQIAFISIQRTAARDPFSAAWKGLSVIFLLCSIEEIASYHENFMIVMREHFPQPLFHYPWVIPGLIVVGVLGIVYFRWFVNLPKSFRQHFFFALAVYLSGALGVEILGGFYAERFGVENFTYVLIAYLEEWMEMTGINLFFYSFGFYLIQGTDNLRIEAVLQVQK